MQKLMILLVALAMILVACDDGGSDEADSSGASDAVENYLNAKVESDENGIRELICADLESEISRETNSFASVEASIEGMSCAVEGTDGDFTLVTCEGEIVALYGAENRNFPLTTYRTIEEDGAWRWCGEG